MADPESSGFNVVDRRRAASSEQAETSVTDASTETSSAPDAPEQNTAEAERSPDSPGASSPAETGDEEPYLPDPSTLLAIAAMQMETSQLAATLIAVFDGHAWRNMGLVARPGTNEIKADLPSAQIAIDCVQFLLSKADANLNDSERREAQRRLTDLRMNYVAQLNEQGKSR